MASKYLMMNLRESLVRIVESEWPLTVDDFDARDQLLHDYFERRTRGNGEDLRDEWPVLFIPEPGAAIALAEEFGIRSILPAAYYDLSRCNPHIDWVKFNYVLPAQSFKPARWGCLSRSSLRKLYRLQDFLLDEANDIFYGWGDDVEKECNCPLDDSRQGECKKAWVELVELEGSDMSFRAHERDILLDLRSLRTRVSQSSVPSIKICFQCQRKFIKAIDDRRRGVWERIQEVCSEEEEEEYR